MEKRIAPEIVIISVFTVKNAIFHKVKIIESEVYNE